MTDILPPTPNIRKYFENDKDFSKFEKFMAGFQAKDTCDMTMVKFKNEWLRIERTHFSTYISLQSFSFPGGSNQLYLRHYPNFNDKKDNLTIARCIWHLRETIRKNGLAAFD